MTDRTSRRAPGQTEDGAARIQQAWLRELPDLPAASIGSIGVITRIWQLAKILDDERRRTLERLGTDASTLDLLSTLRRSGSPYRMSVAKITAESLVTQGAVSQRIARAEAAGLVRRAASRTDGRGVDVILTPKGRRLNERSVRALLAHEAGLLSSLPPVEQEQLGSSLRILLDDLAGRSGTSSAGRPGQAPNSLP